MTAHAVRYPYAWGYKTRIAAIHAADDLIADGEVSECENPEVTSYRTADGATRYKITLEDTST